MGTGKGRRARKKRRQRLKQSSAGALSLCHENQFVELRKWLHERGFQCNSLIPAQFSDTGRGLMTTQFIQAGDVLIALPERCLLTTATVLKSYLGEYIRRWKPAISPLLALCVFLISERHLGRVSQWKPYIDILPRSYTCPLYFSDEVVGLLPKILRKKVLSQRNMVFELHTCSQDFFKSLQTLFSHSVEDIFTCDALRWAWCSVNSRTVYMEHQQSPDLSTDPDTYAMAPYLDLLNHSPDVQVKAGFNQVTQCYEIQSMQGCKRFQQTFICYGPHDSQRLLLEYGFVAPNNPHRVVYVDPDILQQYFSEVDKQFAQKILFLKERGFLTNLTFGPDGPSWKLMTVLRLLSLKPEQYAFWKPVLLGATVSPDTEEQSLVVAWLLCHHFKQENTEARDKLSLMKFDWLHGSG
ncbi:SET domain-containing protein 4 isoform X1 [Arapaima gigas]